MDEKGFDRLQGAVQWVVDNHRAMRVGEQVSLVHQQRVWGTGILQDEVLPHPTGLSRELPGMQTETRPVCGTACCLAGYVVLAHGDTFANTVNEQSNRQAGDVVSVTWCIDSEGEAHPIGERARELMGISQGDASVLFDGNNEVWHIRDFAREIAAKHGYKLEIL